METMAHFQPHGICDGEPAEAPLDADILRRRWQWRSRRDIITTHHWALQWGACGAQGQAIH